MATHAVAPGQTVVIKSVPKNFVQRMTDTVWQNTSATSVHSTPDKDPKCTGKFIFYANYKSGREAQKACSTLQAWVDDKWPSATARRPTIMTKQSFDVLSFGVFVTGAPQFTEPSHIERIFAMFGTLHAGGKVCAIKDGYAFFVNFADYEGAQAALEAARSGRLYCEGCALQVRAQRNTLFINELVGQMRETGKHAFSIDDAKGVGDGMKDWAPQPKDVAALLSRISHWEWDRRSKQFRFVQESKTSGEQSVCTTADEALQRWLPPVCPRAGPEVESQPTWHAPEMVFRTLFEGLDLSENMVPSGFAQRKRQEQFSPSPNNNADHVLDDDASSVCITPPRLRSPSPSLKIEGDSVSLWDEDQVLSLFRRCKFPTEGIVANNVDGPALLRLYADADAEDMFTAPAPDGLGFNKILYRGRFASELAKLSRECPSFDRYSIFLSTPQNFL